MLRFISARRALPILLAGSAACALATPERVYLKQVAAPSGEAAQVDATMQQFAKEGFSGSVLVARGSRVVLYKGYGDANRARELPNTAETKYPFGALTSMFTATAILGLESEGKLRLDQRAAEYVGPAAGDATIGELLTRSREDAGGVRIVPASSTDEPDAAVERFRTLGASYPLLEGVIAAASGRPAAEVIRERQFGPAGLDRTVYDDGRLNDSLVARGYTTPHGATVVVTGLVGPLADLYRWHQALRMGTLLPLAARDRMLAPSPTGYAMGWVVSRTSQGDPVIQHASDQVGFQLWYGYFPADDLLILLAANNDDGFRQPVAAALAAQLSGGGVPEGRQFVTNRREVGGS